MEHCRLRLFGDHSNVACCSLNIFHCQQSESTRAFCVTSHQWFEKTFPLFCTCKAHGQGSSQLTCGLCSPTLGFLALENSKDFNSGMVSKSGTAWLLDSQDQGGVFFLHSSRKKPFQQNKEAHGNIRMACSEKVFARARLHRSRAGGETFQFSLLSND